MSAQATKELTFDFEKRYEIIKGQPVAKESSGGLHGVIAARLATKLGGFILAHGLGEASTEASYKIGNDERILDLSFVSTARIPASGIPADCWPIPPDLAIEVISPNDLYDQLTSKVFDYFDAGVKQVWLISPGNKTVTVFRSLENVLTFRGKDTELISEDLLPGFRCKLGDLFPNSASII